MCVYTYKSKYMTLHMCADAHLHMCTSVWKAVANIWHLFSGATDLSIGYRIIL